MTTEYCGKNADKHFYIVTFRRVSEAVKAVEKYNGSALFGYNNVGLSLVSDYASIMELNVISLIISYKK